MYNQFDFVLWNNTIIQIYFQHIRITPPTWIGYIPGMTPKYVLKKKSDSGFKMASFYG